MTMNYTAVSKYAFDINTFNLVFSLVIGIIMGFFWSIVIFCSFGILIGYLVFNLFKKNEYYMYYNLGFTKKNLLLHVWLLNLIISLPIFIVSIVLQ